jgi:hypothetical protein
MYAVIEWVIRRHMVRPAVLSEGWRQLRIAAGVFLFVAFIWSVGGADYWQ